MKNDCVYAIFSGCYSDWDVHGYFLDETKAQKYCALKNKKQGENDFYVEKIDFINADVTEVKLKYYHEVTFQFGKGMVKESDSYDYYSGEDRKPRITYSGCGWISFEFNCETREKAEKIAQDKYAEFLCYYAENQDYEESAKLLRIGLDKDHEVDK